MTTALHLRHQIESDLAHRIPSALTPRSRAVRPTTPTGIGTVDTLLEGGLPVGALTEIVGPVSSGRTSLALSSLARLTASGKVCAWVDVSDSLKPECAAAAGIALPYLLWVRCGVTDESKHMNGTSFQLPQDCLLRPAPVKGLHGGGCGTHPREESKGVARALEGFFGRQETNVQSALPAAPPIKPGGTGLKQCAPDRTGVSPWTRIEQALKTADLLLQGGGFSAVVLDMAGMPPSYTSRIPLSHWFRYRAAAEHSRASVLLLTQHACANSSAGLVLHLGANAEAQPHETVFARVQYKLRVHRQRFGQETNVIPIKRPVAKVTEAVWASHPQWAGRR